ncbi:rhomboid family intramembrane serine protease [Paradesertivirga mongoliensis]|uniref:Rhomboid family intramembrane serine protease n=1 Tax=Paradesertivirga mongoliensis TaxID=2100740 RepID=A0ABW4ZJH0_9SPHI|nr:rhomboid family intramembrane serine protease [Pedobacter mongoliensis]
MKQSMFKELWNKMFYSGSRLYLFIGINVIVFLVLGILRLEYLFTRDIAITNWLQLNLSVPADLEKLLYKPWTVATYMFAHTEIFHFLINMLVLYWFGRIFEDFLNGKQFTFIYLAGGLFGALLFLLFYNIFPAFEDSKYVSILLGASGSIMAIVVAIATLVPDYSVRLLLFGDVRLKYLALVYVLLDVISIAGTNPGGSIAHLGGSLFGYIFIKQLQNGNDWSKMFQSRKRLKVVKNSGIPPVSSSRVPEQELIDQILDKISRSGYNSLTQQEKEQLFKASNKE